MSYLSLLLFKTILLSSLCVYAWLGGVEWVAGIPKFVSGSSWEFGKFLCIFSTSPLASCGLFYTRWSETLWTLCPDAATFQTWGCVGSFVEKSAALEVGVLCCSHACFVAGHPCCGCWTAVPPAVPPPWGQRPGLYTSASEFLYLFFVTAKGSIKSLGFLVDFLKQD